MCSLPPATQQPPRHGGAHDVQCTDSQRQGPLYIAFSGLYMEGSPEASLIIQLPRLALPRASGWDLYF